MRFKSNKIMKLKNIFLPILKMITVTAMFMVVFAACDKNDEEQQTTIRPTVTLSDPIKGATNVALNATVSVTFSEVMDASTITSSNFTLKNGTTIVPGAIAYNGKTATMTPSAELAPNTLYTGALKSAKNMKGKSIASDFTWTFTTGSAPDTSLPTVTSTAPAANATGVALDAETSLIFSEEMAPLTISSTTLTMKQGETAIAGTVSYSGTTAKFKPTAALEHNKVYTISLTTAATDLVGNAMATAYSFTFTTLTAPVVITDEISPVVTSTNPADNATNIARSAILTVDFSEAMDAATITASTFTVFEGSNAIAGAIVYSGTTATFTPSALLTAGTQYTATVTTGAKDLAGNALDADVVFSFTTIADPNPSGLAAVDLGTAGNYVILAKTAVNNIPTSAITGHVALSPAATSFITGFALTNATGYATSPQVTGKLYAADMVSPTSSNLTTAVENMITAYNDAAGRPSPDFLELATGNIGGLTLAPGLYKWTSTVTMPSDLVISGNSNDVWIFQMSGNLTMSSGVNITLQGGAKAENIFWQVAGAVTIGTTAHFEGIILSKTGITLQTGASMNGRALAQTAVILDSNTVTQPQ
jgi:methionine-rich copper-binding protein CopC